VGCDCNHGYLDFVDPRVVEIPTARSTGVPLYGRSYPHSFYDCILRYGIRFGTDRRQDRVPEWANAEHLLCAIHTVVYQRTTHPPYVTADDRPSAIRYLPHHIHDHRHGNHCTRRRTHPDVVQVGFLCFFFSGFALLYVVCTVLFDGLRSRFLAHKKFYGIGAGYITVIWVLYPICWAVSEGGNVITVDHEMIFYSIIDIFAGPIFVFAFLAALRSVDYDALGLQSGKASDYVGGRSPAYEKAQEARGESTA